MAGLPDPYRVLELSRDATLDDIKRAYRRLAKQHHPDSGGERALPRFLEIQAAYEQLVGGAGGPGGNGRRSAPRAGPWQAEDVRADATRRAYGTRARRTTGRTGSGGAGGAGAGRAGAGAADGGRSGTASRGAAGPGDGARERPPRRGRAPNKATMGSTTYDGVEDEPFEPGWTGASWYGTTSGTYWTLNPKEYADPRKHGPEYQARARRRRAGEPEVEPGGFVGADAGAPDDREGADPLADSASETAARATGSTGEGREDAATGDATPPNAEGWSATPETGPGATWSAAPKDARQAFGAGPARRSPPGWTWRAGSGHPDDTGERRPEPLRDGGGGAARPPIDPFDPGSAFSDMAGALLRTPSRPLHRLALAVAGGAPLGLSLAWLLGELTGCGRFSATCDPGVVSFAWLAGLAIIAVLVLLPAAASITTAGTIAAFAAGIPATVLLSATGGARMPEASSAVLGVILVIGWLAGVVYAIARRRGRSAATGPVS